MTRKGKLLLEAFGGIDTSGTFEQLPCDLSNIQNCSDTVKGPEKQ